MTEHRDTQEPDEQDLMREAQAIGQIYRNNREPPPADLRARIEAQVAQELTKPLHLRPAPNRRRQHTWALAASLAFAAILAGQIFTPSQKHTDRIALPSDTPPELNDLLRTRSGPSTDEYRNARGNRLSLARQPNGNLQASLFGASYGSSPLLAGIAIPGNGILTLRVEGTEPASCRIEMRPEGLDLILHAQGCGDDIAAAVSDGHFHGQARPQK